MPARLLHDKPNALYVCVAKFVGFSCSTRLIQMHGVSTARLQLTLYKITINALIFQFVVSYALLPVGYVAYGISEVFSLHGRQMKNRNTVLQQYKFRLATQQLVQINVDSKI